MKFNMVAVEPWTVTSFRVDVTEKGIFPESDTLTVSESFDLDIRNSESSSHVHVSVGGDAARFTSMTADNVFVEDEETLEVVVGPTPEDVEGTLEVVVDYGAEEESVDLVIESEAPDPETSSVEVDESLSKPMRPDEATAGDDLPRVDILVGVVLGFAAFFSLLGALLFEGFEVIGVVLGSFAILGAAFVWFVSRSGGTPRPKD